MIVGTTDIDMQYIRQHVGDPDTIVKYACSLVPSWASHIQGIMDNQRYLVAVKLRNMLSIPYKVRESATSALIEGISLYGMVNDFVSITEIIDLCDKDKLAEALKWRIRTNE